VNLEDDSCEELEAEAAVLYQARQILAARFRSEHQRTAGEVRKAAARLIERARHPSRSVALPVPDQGGVPDVAGE
jgi:hypothetical protein